ncbi:MAG: phosphomannomutase/phosphoglucomutase [Candidatus Gracilibacteria bacterium]
MFQADILNAMFKAYDIRGTYPDQINAEFAFEFGKAFVKVLNVKSVAVGRDMRISSDELFEALSRGIMSQGADVIELGRVSTDMLYFACGKYGYEAGIMITASHNPKQWNGMKACLKNAEPLSLDNGMSEMRDLMLRGEIEEGTEQGTKKFHEVMDDWITHVLSFADTKNIKPMKIVVDAGNGMAGRMVEKLFEKLPQLELVPLYFEEDGTFPNHPASPLEEENLVDIKGKMEQEEADLGMAFDGDADRVFLIDDNYETLTGTLMTAMVAKSLLQKDPNQTILYNAICGRIVPETITNMGGTAKRVRVGHSLIKQDMKAYKASFAGEHSGHYYFSNNWNADSGLIAAVIMLDLIGQEGKKLHDLRKKFETYKASGEINFKVENIPAALERIKSEFADLEQNDLDGLTLNWPASHSSDRSVDWWANIRASNTEPLLRLNVEAKTDELLKEKTQKLTDIIQG